MLSIVIPTDQREENSLFHKTLEDISDLPDIEIIFVSKLEAKSRANRLNIGFHKSKGNIILFHHPRSFVAKDGIKYLLEKSKEESSKKEWGAFTHIFDYPHLLLKFTSWYSNEVRGKRKNIFYLDHCIYFHRSLWLDDLPDVEIFEDTILSYYFRKISKPILLPYKSTTSAIRFKKNGIWKQSILNQFLKMGFHLKISTGFMNRIYEKGLNLNEIKSKNNSMSAENT